MKWVVAVFVAVQFLKTALAAKILAICVAASHSHSLWCYKYMAALAERGHQITVLGVDEPKIKIPNLTPFIVTGVYEKLFAQGNTDDYIANPSKVQTMYPNYKNWNEITTREVLHSKAVKDLIKQYKNVEKPFDLIIHDNTNAEATLGLVPLFGNPPLILATTYSSPQWMTFRVGNIFNPAYVPSMIMGAGQRMKFYDRCLNTFYYIFLECFTRFITEPYQDQLMREVFGSHLPHVRDIMKQANIVIVNYHSALDEPRPLLPGVIGIAGLHISEPQPLPQDIKDFMDEAKHGVILLSFGSNVNSNWLGNAFESTVVEGLRQLPQRVLWKWDKDVPNTPPNVRVSKWLPQGDILAHPNIRLFVTHCGLLSIQEAIFRKVPVLALPIFLDQLDIAEKLVRRNLTIQLDTKNLTSDQLRNGIKQILSKPMYKKKIEKLGELMQDIPQTAKQQAVFWTEYAIRHHGAAHLRSAAADMPWYKLLLLDVLGLVLVLLFITVRLIKAVILFVFKKITFCKVKTKAD